MGDPALFLVGATTFQTLTFTELRALQHLVLTETVVLYLDCEEVLIPGLSLLGELLSLEMTHMIIIHPCLKNFIADMWFGLTSCDILESILPGSESELQALVMNYYQTKEESKDQITSKQIAYLDRLLNQRKNKKLKNALYDDPSFLVEKLTKSQAIRLINYVLGKGQEDWKNG